MNNYLSTPDCSFSGTIKVFRIMIDELKDNLEKWDYEFVKDNIIQLRERDIKNGKFKKNQFLRLMQFYLHSKASQPFGKWLSRV